MEIAILWLINSYNQNFLHYGLCFNIYSYLFPTILVIGKKGWHLFLFSIFRVFVFQSILGFFLIRYFSNLCWSRFCTFEFELFPTHQGFITSKSFWQEIESHMNYETKIEQVHLNVVKCTLNVVYQQSPESGGGWVWIEQANLDWIS